MPEDKRAEFIALLEAVYGTYLADSALFGNANYSKISADLCYSNSHFSKLISGGASQAMYDRALNNLLRIQKQRELETRVYAHADKTGRVLAPIYRLVFFVLLLVVVGIAAVLYFRFSGGQVVGDGNHPFEAYFNFKKNQYYKSPYLTEEQVHEFCPGSAFEGRWELAEEYILPIPYKTRGLYYVGKSADIRLKVKKSTALESGRELIGFENIINEIWFDLDQDIDSSKDYQDISTDERFVKLANVFSCFYDEIIISPDSIRRRGEPCGRYANIENDDVLEKYNLDLDHIIEYVIGDMVFAQCAPVANEFCDPNDLINGLSTLVFNCSCSIKTANPQFSGYDYQKAIRLVDQNYQSDIFCNCE